MFKQIDKIRDEREARTGMRQSRGAMTAKLFVSLIFITTGLCLISEGHLSTVLFSCSIGLGFLAWGLVPYLVGVDSIKHGSKRSAFSEAICTMHQRFGGMVVKLTIGLIFIVVMLDEVKTETESFIFTVVIGLGFIAWGLIPFIIALNNKKKQDIEELLSMPLYEFGEDDGEDEAEMLAKKYGDK